MPNPNGSNPIEPAQLKWYNDQLKAVVARVQKMHPTKRALVQPLLPTQAHAGTTNDELGKMTERLDAFTKSVRLPASYSFAAPLRRAWAMANADLGRKTLAVVAGCILLGLVYLYGGETYSYVLSLVSEEQSKEEKVAATSSTTTDPKPEPVAPPTDTEAPPQVAQTQPSAPAKEEDEADRRLNELNRKLDAELESRR